MPSTRGSRRNAPIAEARDREAPHRRTARHRARAGRPHRAAGARDCRRAEIAGGVGGQGHGRYRARGSRRRRGGSQEGARDRGRRTREGRAPGAGARGGGAGRHRRDRGGRCRAQGVGRSRRRAEGQARPARPTRSASERWPTRSAIASRPKAAGRSTRRATRSSNEQVLLEIKLELLRRLPEIIEQSVKPMERIDGIKIVDVRGLGQMGGGEGSAGVRRPTATWRGRSSTTPCVTARSGRWSMPCSRRWGSATSPT